VVSRYGASKVPSIAQWDDGGPVRGAVRHAPERVTVSAGRSGSAPSDTLAEPLTCGYVHLLWQSGCHHEVHWLDGGATDLDNAALLCQRHHTVVHDRRYVGAVRATPDEVGRFVVWDCTHGSYDRHLEPLWGERGVADPRPLTPDRVAELVAAIQADDPHDAYWAKVELDHERDDVRREAQVMSRIFE